MFSLPAARAFDERTAQRLAPLDRFAELRFLASPLDWLDVERNPVRAGLVKRAQNWRFSSAAVGSGSFSLAVSEKVPDPLVSAHSGNGVRHRNSPEPDPISSGTLREPDPFSDPESDESPGKPLAHWLVRGPSERPEPWLHFVNREEQAEELARLRECVNRGSPFGDQTWRENAAIKLGLESTIRPRGRPRNEIK